MVKLVRYSGSQGWSALYNDGKLVIAGGHNAVDEKIAEICGVENINSDDFMRGASYAIASTLEEISDYQQGLNDIAAEKLREKARQLAEEASQLHKEADRLQKA